MAAQLAHEALGARRVIAKINDPVRAEAYADLGIATLCRTNLMADAIDEYLGFPVSDRHGVTAPTGTHDGVEHPPTEAGLAGRGGTADGAPDGQAPVPAREV
jgi:hypothetical protein